MSRALARGIYICIALSALASSVETLPNLPPDVRHMLRMIEMVFITLFAVEYATRVIAAPVWWRHTPSLWGLIDLRAIVHALLFLAPDFAALRTPTLLRTLRLMKLFRADTALDRMARALVNTRTELAVFAFLALVTLFLAVVGIYHLQHATQPKVFSSISASILWAIATLTTVGYGDTYPVTVAGQAFTDLILIVGLGIVAVPAGLLTAALIKELGPKDATDDTR